MVKKNIFVNRKKILDKLTNLKDKLEEGTGQTIFLEGEPGVGKTTLLREFRDVIQSEGYEFLSGSCRAGINKPYLPFRDIWEKKKNKSLPTLKEIGKSQSLDLADKDMLESKRKNAFYGTAQDLRKELKEVPHVILIEDMHDADKGTMNLFHYLADRLSDEPIIFICTYRPGDVTPDDDFTKMKNQMSRKDLYEKIILEPLSEEKSAEMVEKLLGCNEIPDNFSKLLHERTNGNPLFIRVSLRHMLEKKIISPWEGRFPKTKDEFIMPDILQDVIERRVNMLSKKARRIIQLGSVIGEEIPFSILVESSDIDELEILENVDELLERNLWKENEKEESFYFMHQSIKRTIYKGLGKWAERQKLHLRVARSIESINEQELEKYYLNLGNHYHKGENHKKAIEYFIKGAEEAKKSFAPEDAIEMYEKALDIAFDHSFSREETLQLVEDLAETYRVVGKFEKSLELLNRGISLIENLENEQKLYVQIISTLQEQGEYKKALKIINERLLFEGEKDIYEKEKLLGKKGWSLMKLGHFKEAKEVFEKGIEISKNSNDEEALGQAYHNLGSVSVMMRKFDEAVKNLQKAKDIRDDLEDLRELSATMNNLAGVYTINGNLDKAIDVYEECLECYKKMGDKSKQAQIHNNIGVVYSKKGELDEAIKQIKEGLKLVEIVRNKFEKTQLLTNKGDVYLEKGEYDKALNSLKKSRDIIEQTGRLQGKIEVEYLMGRVSVKIEDIEKAEDHLKNLESLVSKREVNRDIGLVKHLKGQIERNVGNLEESKNLLEEAIDVFEESNSLDQRAFCMYELANVIKEKNDDKHQEIIEEAFEYFYERGMLLWKDRCEKLLTFCESLGEQ